MTDLQLVTAFEDAPGYGRLASSSGERGSPLLAQPIGAPGQEEELVDAALRRLKGAGAAYGDLRLGRDHVRTLSLSDENIVQHHMSVSAGIGVRALVEGFWGFAATSQLTVKGVERAATHAVAMAKAVAAVSPRELGLKRGDFADEPAHRAQFHTPVKECLFAGPVPEMAAPFREAARLGLTVPGILRVSSGLDAYGRRRIFASTDGAYILTTHSVVDTVVRFIAVHQGTSAYRSLAGTAMAGGFEHVRAFDFPSQAKAAAQEALAKCTATKPEPGPYTLILDGHNLALTMHESVGHPTELDRVLGYELGFAGGSFASLDKRGSFKYGSPIVNFTANNRLRFGGASVGFDDEGVECQSFPVIREGTLVGYGTSRETAVKIGEKRANGTCRSTSWGDTPIVRIPNLFLEPGKDKLSLDDLIKDTKNGIWMQGRDSFSIDQMRYNFQFGADMSYRIRDGKLAEPLRDVIYQSISPDFWGSCDAICDASEWQMHGVFNCGKGQPIQIAKMMHGAAPSRFQGIRVGY